MDSNPYASTDHKPVELSRSNFHNGLFERSGWLTVTGILLIINGVFQIFGITIIVAWLLIWSGIMFLQAGSEINRSRETESQECLNEGLDKIGLGMKLSGIFVIATISLMVLFFGFIFLTVLLTTI